MARTIDIGGRKVGAGERPYLIAEVGINHGGDVGLCRKLIELAAASGADSIKLQAYRSGAFLSRRSPYFSILESCEIRGSDMVSMVGYAKEQGLELFASVFDEASADMMEDAGTRLYKIASGDLTHSPLLRHVSGFGKPMIVSTGGATMGDIDRALNAIAAGGTAPVVLLHCVSQYPTAPENVNLLSMDTMARQFGVPVGFSDHTIGEATAIAAVALGACVIEKHFTYDRAAEGPDHALSSDPAGLRILADALPIAWKARGGTAKAPVEAADFIPQIRRSVTADREIAAGTVITREMLAIKRPGTGIQPEFLNRVIGMRAVKDLAADAPIGWLDVEHLKG